MQARLRMHFEALLRNERDRILALLAEVTAVPASVAAAPPGEESEPGVVGAARVDDLALVAHESISLGEIDQALLLLRDDPDRYGVCIECEQPISEGRLELIPTTRFCARHAPGMR